MAFGMFSANPFEAFERGYGYDAFNPWTTSFNRPQFIRSQSARRFVNPVPVPFMWDMPREMAMNDNYEDYPFRKRHYEPRRSGRSKKSNIPQKIRDKTPQAHREPVFNETPEANNEQSLKNTNSGSNEGHNLKSPEQQMANLRVRSEEDATNQQEPSSAKVSTNKDSDYVSTQESDGTEPIQQIQVDCVDIHNIEAKACSKPEHQPEVKVPENNCDHDELPEVKETEVYCNQDKLPEVIELESNCNQDETLVRVDDSDENNEIKDEKSNEEESTMKNKTLKRLDQIEVQLNKAKHLISDYDLSDLKLTDKQRLYLTEMLLHCILDLDKIEAQGHETVKQRRREAVREIQTYLDQVENTIS